MEPEGFVNMNQNKHFNLEFSYDIDVDSIFINIVDEYDYKESIELEEGIILDFDTYGIPVALEILDVSNLFGIDKVSFENIQDIKMKIKINSCINLELKMVLLVKDMEVMQELDKFIKNDINLPEMVCCSSI